MESRTDGGQYVTSSTKGLLTSTPRKAKKLNTCQLCGKQFKGLKNHVTKAHHKRGGKPDGK